METDRVDVYGLYSIVRLCVTMGCFVLTGLIYAVFGWLLCWAGSTRSPLVFTFFSGAFTSQCALGHARFGRRRSLVQEVTFSILNLFKIQSKTVPLSKAIRRACSTVFYWFLKDGIFN